MHRRAASYDTLRVPCRPLDTQDAKLGRLVSQQAALFEEENRRMNTEQERLALEKTHVERDWVHLEVIMMSLCSVQNVRNNNSSDGSGIVTVSIGAPLCWLMDVRGVCGLAL